MAHRETSFDRSLWTIVLTAAVAFVVFSFARGPLSGSGGSASAIARPLTLWVAGGEAAGETEALARQAAACWQLDGRTATVGVLPGGSVEAVDEFLDRTRGASDELLLLTSGTLSQIAYDQQQPPGTQAHQSAQMAARLLLAATPVAMLGSDEVSLAVRANSPIQTTSQLLALMREHSSRPLVSVAEEAWLEGSLASLAQSAGVWGPMPFSAYRSSREVVVSLDSGEADAIVAPHSALVPDLRRGRLHKLQWPRSASRGSPSGANRGWVAILAPSGLAAGALASLRRQAAELCHGGGWRERVRQDGLSPARASLASLRDLIRGGLAEAIHVQALASRLVRNY